ncbi:MAG: preprotein translocase subunit YajC [Oscillospiraceae bacterium]|nr:preprotein translocase subunit YajC [Oscillospiraceae bacterium]
MNFLNLLDAAASNANGQQQATSFGALLGTFLPLILMFVVVYFFMIRPQKKRDKQIQDMRSNLQIGDEVITTGGIIGIIAGIKEDTVLIETGSDRSKIRLARWAIAQNNTVHEEA